MAAAVGCILTYAIAVTPASPTEHAPFVPFVLLFSAMVYTAHHLSFVWDDLTMRAMNRFYSFLAELS
jgi:hypothetical protein